MTQPSEECMTPPSEGCVVTTKVPYLFGIEVKLSSVETTKPGEWISTEVIDICLEKNRLEICAENTAKSRCIVFGTGVDPIVFRDYKANLRLDPKVQKHLNNVFDKGYQKIGSPNVDDIDAVMYPHFDSGHYTLTVVWVKDRKVTYCDSFGGFKPDVCEKILKFTVDQLNRFCNKNKSIKFHEFLKRIYLHPNMPTQSNNYDCGFYVIKTAECIMRGENISFTDDVIATLRKNVHEMVSKAFYACN